MIRRHTSGFTLLELLVAIAIFALVAVMAYGGLNTVIRHGEIVQDDTARILDTQHGLRLLRQDLQFAVDRPVRDALGGPVPAFVSGQYRLFSTTRMGMANPWMRPVSQMARVSWRREGDRLERLVQQPLDGQVNSTARTVHWTVELRDVRAVKATFYDDKNQAYQSWPPPNQPDAGLPHAVELVLTMGQLPPVRMTVPLVGSWPRTATGAATTSSTTDTQANGTRTTDHTPTGLDQENER